MPSQESTEIAEIEISVVENNRAPMMLHEEVASGHIGDDKKELRILRSLHGMSWQVCCGDYTACIELKGLIDIAAKLAYEAGQS